MVFLALLVILALAALVVLYVAYTARGRSIPRADWLSERMAHFSERISDYLDGTAAPHHGQRR